jgi:SMI1-KNR4 cell-wall
MPFNLAERFIGAAEEELGAPLPHSYRKAMMASNGGEVAAYEDVWNLHPILDKSDRKRLSRTCSDILRETRRMRDWPDWPENAVAIADNGTGDKLLFLREGRLYQPEVYLWLHDTGDVILVAQSFSELRRPGGSETANR